MRPLFIGIVLFLIWLAFSAWFYSKHIFPFGNSVEETAITEVVPDSLATPPKPIVPLTAPGDITLYFDYNRTEILSTELLPGFILESLDYLHADSDACLRLTGYTCDIGTETYNKDLGSRRASSVKSYLLNNGFTIECIQLVSKGEEDPAIANSSEENRKKNRRVTLHINH